MHYVGIDLHKRTTHVTKMDEQGSIVEQRNLRNESGTLKDFVDSLGEEDKVVVEATCNWYHFYEMMEDKVATVTLSHPAKTKAIASARIKNDKIDATMLAHLLRTDLIPPAYIPTRDTRDQKELLRYRASLVRVRTALKNKVHAILTRNGILCPYSDIFGKKAGTWLVSLALRPCYRDAICGCLFLASALKEELDRVTQQIKQMAKQDIQAHLLMTMPGISYYSALLILAEIGEIERFPSAGHLCSYAGLVPSLYSSGSVTRTGSITKAGSTHLRWILVENATHAIKGAHRFKSLYTRITAPSGKNAAKVAVARRMLACMYHMLTRGEPFKDIEEQRRKELANLPVS